MHSLSETYHKSSKGDLWIHQDYEPEFLARDWGSVAGLLQGTWQASLRRRRDYRRGWDNVVLELPNPLDSATSVTVFMKRHRTYALPRREPAFREAVLADYCQMRGVPCMQLVAVGVSDRPVVDSQGRSFSSVFMTSRIGYGMHVFEKLMRCLDLAGRRSPEIPKLIDSVAAVVGKMHSAGVYHGDCHLKNLIIERKTATGFELRVIDFQKSLRAPAIQGYYRWLKDMCLLRYSWLELDLYHEFGDLWYERYRHWAQGKHIQRWLACGGTNLIAARGDVGIIRRITSRASRGEIDSAARILSQRFPRRTRPAG